MTRASNCILKLHAEENLCFKIPHKHTYTIKIWDNIKKIIHKWKNNKDNKLPSKSEHFLLVGTNNINNNIKFEYV